MTSLRQIEANRRNARLSTGPVTEGGKNRSRQNAIRHGLTAETVITAFEDASDYAAFELAITRDYDPQTAVERELVLRLASLLWRLRRTTAIESGLFNMQASQRPHFTEPELEPRGQNPDEDPSKSKRTEMQGTKVVHTSVKTRIGASRLLLKIPALSLACSPSLLSRFHICRPAHSTG
ncbi:hypothetical protein ACVWZW_000283 [Bradyrhizobium sp. F1.13.4]